MASFWQTSEGTVANGDVVDNEFKPIPKGWYKSIIEELVIKSSVQFGDKISVKARIQGQTHTNRVIFCNLKVYDEKPQARDRALNVLVAIAGAAGVALPKGEPDDAWLAKLTNKTMEMLFDVWEMDGRNIDPETGDLEKLTGNWLVNARPSGPQQQAKPQAQRGSIPDDVASDDIPF